MVFIFPNLIHIKTKIYLFSGVKYLLTEKDTDPNVILPNIGISPFHLAIGNDSLVFANKVVQLILQNRGNPDVQ